MTAPKIPDAIWLQWPEDRIGPKDLLSTPAREVAGELLAELERVHELRHTDGCTLPERCSTAALIRKAKGE